MKRYKKFDNANVIEVIIGCSLLALPFLMIIAKL